MSKFRNALVALAGLLILAGAIALVTPRAGFGQGQGVGPGSEPPRPVKVLNLPSEPIPVVGTTTIGGNVNLAPDTTVGITGTPDVLVGNPANSPVLVRDVDNPARQPFQTSVDCTVSGALKGCAGTFLVPSDKRLVIEYVSMLANIPAGEVAELEISTFVAGAYETHGFPRATPAITFAGSASTSLGHQVRLYSDPGFFVVVHGNRSGTGTGASFHFAVSGYLVDAP